MKKAHKSLMTGVSIAAIAAATPSALTAQETQDAVDRSDVDTIVVRGTRYRQPTTNLSRSPATISEIPNSLTVLNNAVIKDQVITDFGELLNNAAGVSRDGALVGFYDNFVIRGIQISGSGINTGVRENGLAGGLTYPVDPALIERVEIIKGPASIAGGGAPVGGLINRVLKTPYRGDDLTLSAIANTFGEFRGSIDANRTLGDDAAARLVVAGAFGEGPVDRESGEHIAVLPSLQFNVSDRTEVTLLGQYYRGGGEPFVGIGLRADGEIPVDRADFNWNYDEDGTLLEERHKSIQADLVHEFLDDLTLTARVGYSDTSSVNDRLYSFNYLGLGEPSNFIGPDDAFIYAGRADIATSRFAGDVYLRKDFQIGDNTSSFVVGADHVRQDRERFATYQVLGVDNILNPQVRFETPDDIAINNEFRDIALDVDQTGVYGQLVLRPIDRLTVIGGVRFDMLNQSADQRSVLVSAGTIGLSDIETDDDAFTWRLGASYEIIDNVMVYASYSEAFLNNADAVTRSGEFLDAEEGQQYEAGLKADLFNDTMFFTASFFDITRQNVAGIDPQDFRFASARGEETIQGVELELAGEPLPGLNILGAYTYIDAEITDDGLPAGAPGQFDGNTPPAATENQFSLFVNYEFQNGPLEGFGISGNVFYKDDIFLDLPNQATADGYVVLGASAFYNFDNGLSIRIAGRNLTDELYIPGQEGINYVRFGERRHAVISISKAF